MTKKITVGPGPVGVIFGGSPPEIKTIKESSALAGVANEGDYIVGLIVPGVVEQMGGLDEKSLASLLKQHSDAKERILIIEKDSSSFPKGKISKVHAKSGKIGVVFGGSPPVVTEIRDDSPLAGRVTVGQVVTGLSVPGRVDLEGNFGTHELVSTLKANENEEDRILTLSDGQGATTDPEDETTDGAAIPPTPRAKPGGSIRVVSGLVHVEIQLGLLTMLNNPRDRSRGPMLTEKLLQMLSSSFLSFDHSSILLVVDATHVTCTYWLVDYLLIHDGVTAVIATAAALGAAAASYLAVDAVINTHAAHHPSQIRNPSIESVAGAFEHHAKSMILLQKLRMVLAELLMVRSKLHELVVVMMAPGLVIRGWVGVTIVGIASV